MTEKKRKKISTRQLAKCKQEGQKIAALTAYDACFGRLADEAGMHLVLVGDSVGMTTLGYKTTLPVTLEQSLHHTAAVVRGVEYAMVVGDMPFLSFQVTPEEALYNAGRYLKEAGADGVKIEGGKKYAHTIERLVEAGIPVLAHIGLLPQAVLEEGGYRIHGREPAEAQALEEDALAVQEAGAFGVVFEGLPRELGEKITGKLDIPTIGIGAGNGCDGQIQVIHDILGLSEDFVPKHAKQYASLGEDIRNALRSYVSEVQDGTFPDKKHSFS